MGDKYKRSILIDAEMKEDLEILAEFYGVKFSRILNLALREFIAKNYDSLKMMKNKDILE